MSGHRPSLIEAIKKEHKHFANRIVLLRRELDAQAENRHPDYELLSLLAVFFEIFPDEIHHKKEDYIYDALIRNGVVETDYLVRLKAEHEQMHEMTEQFIGELKTLVERRSDTPSSLIDAVNRYVDLQEIHMADEESQFLPLAQSCLPEARFDHIERQIQADLITEETHQAFKKLAAIDANIDKHLEHKGGT